MSVFIARSALATLLLETAQRREPGLTGLWVDFVAIATIGGNWRVSKIEVRSSADEPSARAAVDEAVGENTTWVMVEDDDPRDGQAANER